MGAVLLGAAAMSTGADLQQRTVAGVVAQSATDWES